MTSTKTTLVGIGSALALLVSTAAHAVSMTATGPAEPLPEQRATPVALISAELPAEFQTTGSSTLMPLVAIDLPTDPASSTRAVGAPAGNAVKTGPIDDLAFVTLATASGSEEARNAREALSQLKDSELKRVAETLARRRSDANARLGLLAAARMWPVHRSEHLVTPPAGTALPDFDAKWTSHMIAVQERSLALYRAQARSGEDPELRQYARDTLPMIQHHLTELRRLQK